MDVVIEFWFVFGGALDALSALPDDGTVVPTDEGVAGSCVGTAAASLGFDGVEPAITPTLVSCSTEL